MQTRWCRSGGTKCRGAEEVLKSEEVQKWWWCRSGAEEVQRLCWHAGADEVQMRCRCGDVEMQRW